MKKVKEIYYLENRKERASDFSTGFLYILEDGSKVETMMTDTIAERYTIDPNPFNLGHPVGKSANTQGEQYERPSYAERGMDKIDGNRNPKHEMNKMRYCKNCGMIAEDLGFKDGCKLSRKSLIDNVMGSGHVRVFPECPDNETSVT